MKKMSFFYLTESQSIGLDNKIYIYEKIEKSVSTQITVKTVLFEGEQIDCK